MPLAAGTRLGPYEILAPLGAGGMGEVWRARDSRLGRDVAIKVLASHLAPDDDLRLRFEREARAISALNHPNICTLYDVGREGDVDYLVLELVEGHSLADRLARGALPFEQTLRFGRQLAAALERAHRAGIVHRDLKPGNVMVTKSGVKVLDFGLAKLHGADPGAAQGTALGELPTQLEEKPLTGRGSLLGTFQYMAPEQLEGREADARSDVFALGCVLYEMATGRRAFEASNPASLISKILTADPPPVSTVESTSPPAFDRAVRTCLAKDPDERWQSAGDVGAVLGWIEGGETGAREANMAPVRSRFWPAGIAGVVLGVVLGILAAPALRPRTASDAPPVRFTIDAPEGASIHEGVESHDLALSPDGRRLAFVVVRDDKKQIWLRSLDSLTASPIAGTEGARSPFWSPDGKELAFFAGAELRRVALAGGPPQVVCAVSGETTGTWGDGVIVFSQKFMSEPGLHRVAASGGKPEWVWKSGEESEHGFHRWPSFLPGGRRFLVTAAKKGGDGPTLFAGSIENSELREVAPIASKAVYAAGRLYYVAKGVLIARPFDPDTLELRGEPLPLVQEMQSFVTGWAPFTVAADGSLAHRAGTAAIELGWFDRHGRGLGSAAPPSDLAEFRLSPDGRSVALEINDARTGETDLWIRDLERGIATRFSSLAGSESRPVWSADGTRIAFTAHGSQALEIGVRAKRLGDEGDGDPLTPSKDRFQWPNDWLADGSLLFEEFDPETQTDLWLVPPSGIADVRLLLRTKFHECCARVSPDGQWLAYVSSSSGRNELLLRPLEGGVDVQVSASGVSAPARWRADGRELYFVGSDGFLASVAVSHAAGSSPTLGRPEPLFRVPLALSGWSGYFDLEAGGERFLLPTGRPYEAVPITVELAAR